MPERVTTAWWKEERGEKIFVDYNQMARDRTIASAYSCAPGPARTVSAPLRWDELSDAAPEDFDLRDDARRGSPNSATCTRTWTTTPSAWSPCWSWPTGDEATTGSAICRIRPTTRRCRGSRSGSSRAGPVSARHTTSGLKAARCLANGRLRLLRRPERGYPPRLPQGGTGLAVRLPAGRPVPVPACARPVRARTFRTWRTTGTHRRRTTRTHLCIRGPGCHGTPRRMQAARERLPDRLCGGLPGTAGRSAAAHPGVGDRRCQRGAAVAGRARTPRADRPLPLRCLPRQSRRPRRVRYAQSPGVPGTGGGHRGAATPWRCSATTSRRRAGRGRSRSGTGARSMRPCSTPTGGCG